MNSTYALSSFKLLNSFCFRFINLFHESSIRFQVSWSHRAVVAFSFKCGRPVDSWDVPVCIQNDMRLLPFDMNWILALKMNLLESDRDGAQRFEFFREVFLQMLGDFKRVDEDRFSAFDDFIVSSAEQELQPWRRLVVHKIHVRRQISIRKSNVRRIWFIDNVLHKPVKKRNRIGDFSHNVQNASFHYWTILDNDEAIFRDFLCHLVLTGLVDNFRKVDFRSPAVLFAFMEYHFRVTRARIFITSIKYISLKIVRKSTWQIFVKLRQESYKCVLLLWSWNSNYRLEKLLAQARFLPAKGAVLQFSVPIQLVGIFRNNN